MHIIDVNLGGGFLLQYANRGQSQMMGYLIETPDGKTVMIDSGNYCEEDAGYLYELLKSRGGNIDLWLFTHAHIDHFGALLWLFENKPDFDLKIADMRFDFPPVEWFKTVEQGWYYDSNRDFAAALEKHKITPKTITAGENIKCGEISIEVLKDARDYENYVKGNEINDSSAVFKVHFPNRDVLFLGDLGWDGGADLLKEIPNEKLRCGIVQMAHHGQNGVDRAFYEVVQPEICLYCAPDWLWDCDTGGGKGSGPWKTLEVRRWMEELGVSMSCPHAYGDYKFI